MRDRLIELLNKSFAEQYEKRGLLTAPHTADYLLANGVIVPPCKVGDYVLWDNGLKDSKPIMKKVKGFYYNPENLGLRYILEDCQPIINHSCIVSILTKEEAETRLKELGK